MTVLETIDLRERELCAVALEILAEVGYEALSMDALAKRARASKATIYRRWSNKADLVVDALRLVSEDACFPPDTGDLRLDLLATIRAFGNTIPRSAQLMPSVAHAAKNDDRLSRAVRERLYEPRCRVTMAIVEAAIERGELAPSAASLPLFHDLIPALMMARMALRATIDEDFYRDVVDGVLLPVLRQAS